MKTLYIIRGLPGSGKSTLARQLAGQNFHEADQYFHTGGEYRFDASKLKEAHRWCQDCIKDDMQFGVEVLAVSNTFTQRWEYAPYLALAEEHGYRVFILTCNNKWANIHGVPDEAIKRMADRWEEA